MEYQSSHSEEMPGISFIVVGSNVCRHGLGDHLKIRVGQDIPESRDLTPWDLRLFFGPFLWQ